MTSELSAGAKRVRCVISRGEEEVSLTFSFCCCYWITFARCPNIKKYCTKEFIFVTESPLKIACGFGAGFRILIFGELYRKSILFIEVQFIGVLSC